ncbi:MAG: GNAT family N-acetyltransferase [Thermoplasmatota archaeon]
MTNPTNPTAILSGSAGLALRAKRWGEWAAADPEATLFETPAYASYRLQALPSNYEGGIASIREGDEEVGFVPYVMQRSLAGLPSRRLATVGIGAHSPATTSGEVVGRAAEALAGWKPLASLRVESPTLAPPMAVPRHYESRGQESLDPKPGTIKLAEDWDGFLRAQSARFRHRVGNTYRRSVREGWSLVDRTGDGERAVATANDLNDSWQNHRYREAYKGRYRASQRDAGFALAFRDDGFRAYGLQRGDEVASVLYGVRHRETFYLFRQGNAQAFLDVSPSMTLRAFVIERVMGEGVRTLEVVGGTEGHWKTEPPQRQALLFNRRGWVPGLQRWAVQQVLSRKRSWGVGVVRRGLGRVAPSVLTQAE